MDRNKTRLQSWYNFSDWFEVIDGATNKIAQNRAENLMLRFEMVYLTQNDQQWAMLQFRNYRLSYGMDMNDCLIAAPSHRLQVPLFTHNLKHFKPLLGDLAQQPY